MKSYVCLLKDDISEENWTLKMWISLQVEKSFLYFFEVDDTRSAVQRRLLWLATGGSFDINIEMPEVTTYSFFHFPWSSCQEDDQSKYPCLRYQAVIIQC